MFASEDGLKESWMTTLLRRRLREPWVLGGMIAGTAPELLDVGGTVCPSLPIMILIELSYPQYIERRWRLPEGEWLVRVTYKWQS